ncbi:hypothetical protein Nepgr_019976 [Nepenthes gracilis]|uniref:Uncharacterized protein n=1 Tax=Nepenthes gracilis TaxID=150966 RepID=A0AAD3XVQ3_NEPGR|nr:hypothetical protein Nepgr_019976 [Nepenthes gracilis]
MWAIWRFKEFNRDTDVLIQIWMPVKRGVMNFLTTFEQPHFNHPASTSLVNYRNVSEKYHFPADDDSKESFGLPGRVFLAKVPEWTPDVRFFRQDEYPRSYYAHMYDVRGSIGLPVFERGKENCLGVIEIVTTTQKVNYRPEVDCVCRSLEAVDLRSFEILSSSEAKRRSSVYETSLPEILNVLRTACDIHNLPLAKTWAPCIQQGKGGCWHPANHAQCVSTVDSACYVRDPRVQEFHEACSEYHLLRGQGVVGEAFMTNDPRVATDVTAFTKAEYSLSHLAKLFGLRAAVAIQVRSACKESTFYVLEFFLPLDCQDAGLTLHSKLVESVSMEIKQLCQNVRLLTADDLQQQPVYSLNETICFSDKEPNAKDETKMRSSGLKKHFEETSWNSHMIEAPKNGKENIHKKDEPADKFQVTTDRSNTDGRNVEQDSRLEGIIKGGGDSYFGGYHTLGTRKEGEKRKTKAQKSISLQVLRQHFGGILKDAAKNIGVCPTTMKRICRQHGITRWPSRKIKKVGHSLRKLQLEIDSVQGAEGAIQLSSFYANFPELNSRNLSSPNQFSSIQMNGQSNQVNTQQEDSNTSAGATNIKLISPSSNQISTSSHSFSTEAKISPAMATGLGIIEAAAVHNPGKKTHSEAELNVYSQKASALLEKSWSIKSLGEHRLIESTLPLLPRSRSFDMRDEGAFKVKVMFGEEKIRFSIAQNISFGDLQLEIAWRFGIDDVNKIHIKYLDDEKEWVLLTCDADLDECIDIQSSSGSRTIKLFVS